MWVFTQQIQGIMGNLAFSLAFGTILAKMGRIYRIFKKSSKQITKIVSRML